MNEPKSAASAAPNPVPTGSSTAGSSTSSMESTERSHASKLRIEETKIALAEALSERDAIFPPLTPVSFREILRDEAANRELEKEKQEEARRAASRKRTRTGIGIVLAVAAVVFAILYVRSHPQMFFSETPSAKIGNAEVLKRIDLYRGETNSTLATITSSGEKRLAELKEDIKRRQDSSDQERNLILVAMKDGMKSMADNISDFRTRLSTVESSVGELKKQGDAVYASNSQLLGELNTIKAKISSPPQMPPPAAQAELPPPPLRNINESPTEQDSTLDQRLIEKGPAAGQPGATSGKSIETRKWKSYAYAPSVDTRKFSAKKFRNDEVVIVQKKDAVTYMKQYFCRPGFTAEERTPATTRVPAKGSVPTYDDADKVSFRSSQTLIVWELD